MYIQYTDQTSIIQINKNILDFIKQKYNDYIFIPYNSNRELFDDL